VKIRTRREDIDHLGHRFRRSQKAPPFGSGESVGNLDWESIWGVEIVDFVADVVAKAESLG